jgi:ribosomal-protein-alanine N-acetyltransferase
MSLVSQCAAAAHWSREQYEQIFVEHAPRRIALVIEEGQLQQGFLVAHKLAGEWEIENIAVSAASRRRGLGTRLIGEFLETVRKLGASSVFLEVRESNREARSFYENCGMAEIGRRSRYYAQPEEDAIVYRLSLA